MFGRSAQPGEVASVSSVESTDTRSTPAHALATQDVGEEAPAADSSAWSTASGTGALSLTVVMLTVATVALLAAYQSPRFFYNDDTQTGAVGIWYELGRMLSDRDFSVLNLDRYSAGNLLVEGQWSLFNPIIWALGSVYYHVDDLRLVTTILKIVLLALLGAGSYLVARSYRVTPRWAMAAGLSVPLAGFTFYIDAASWVTGLMVFTGLTWTWWAFRRMYVGGASPLLPFLSGYLVVTVGYVHGTIMLATLVAGMLLDNLRRGRSRQFLMVLGTGALLGCVALAVYLPGVLSADVTLRSSDSIANSNFMSPGLGSLFLSPNPNAVPEVMGWWAAPTPAPLMYFSWVLALTPFIRWLRVRRVADDLRALAVLSIVAALFVFGPSDALVLRFPIRVTPYLVLCTMIGLVIIVQRCGLVWSRQRVLVAAALCLITVYLSWSEVPWAVTAPLVGGSIAFIGVTALSSASSTSSPPGERRWIPLILVVTTLLAGTLQQHWFPRPPLADYHLPARASVMQAFSAGLEGEVFTVGPARRPATDGRTSVFANAWYPARTATGNVYTPVGYATYAADWCQDFHGVTCSAAGPHLFDLDPETGTPLADLLSIDTLLIFDDPQTTDGLFNAQPPAGWHRIERADTDTVAWQRDQLTEPAGGVTWTSSGLQITSVVSTDRSLRITLGDVPAQGGRIVTSRLAWPGYTASGATITDPLRGYLLTLDVPSSAAGTSVEVLFTPPGWRMGSVLIVAAPGLALLWSAGFVVLRRRRRSGSGTPTTDLRAEAAQDTGLGDETPAEVSDR